MVKETSRNWKASQKIDRNKERDTYNNRKFIDLLYKSNIDITSFTKFLEDKKDSLNHSNVEVVTCNNYLNADKGLFNILKTLVKHLKYHKKTEEKLGINLNCDIEQDPSSSMKPNEVDYVFLENNLPKYISEFLKLHPQGRMDDISSGNDFTESLQSAVKLFTQISSTSSFVPSKELRSNSEVLQSKFSIMSGDYLQFLKKNKDQSLEVVESNIETFKKDPTTPFNLGSYGSSSVDVNVLKNIECGKNYIYSEVPCGGLNFKHFQSNRYPDDNGYCCYEENTQTYNCPAGHTSITLNGETNCIATGY